MSTLIVINTTASGIPIHDVGDTVLQPGVPENLTDIYPLDVIGDSTSLKYNVENGYVVVSEDGVTFMSPHQGQTYINSFVMDKDPKDRSGKTRVHQTSRKLGTRIYWTGEGDDTTNPTAIGGGTKTSYTHSIGQEEPNISYIDFNIAENETWLHEGYLTWKGAELDTISLELVPRITPTTVSSGTNYNLYDGYLIIPAAGDGTVQIVSDITTHSGGLVYMPDDDLGNPPTAFWNAEWDTTTKKYINITPAPNADGRYNMFAVEVGFAKFINNIPMLSDGFIALNSSDTDQLGQGMRLKMTCDTNNTVADHDWSIASIICLHRAKS